jgi:hypothetical protein
MPHFGLMDEASLGPVESLLMRSRLHIRCGRRRLREGKVSLGIVTLEDAVSSGMQWYLARRKAEGGPGIQEREGMHDDRSLYALLTRSGVLDGSFDYDTFNGLVEKALEVELQSFDYRDTLGSVERLLQQLGVLPFDESKLPPEDPSTP